MPVIGFLAAGTPNSDTEELAAFHRGLGQVGCVDDQNVRNDYRWSGQQNDLLLALAGDLVRRKVAVIYPSGGSHVAQAVKAATSSIPIVFATGVDPIKLGLVASLNHPSGNVTGVTFSTNMLAAKRFTLLHDVVPSAPRIAILMNPTNANADFDLKETQTAARALGLQLQLLLAWVERGRSRVSRDRVPLHHCYALPTG
jgi:putative ABC transport system substrate-binding protein